MLLKVVYINLGFSLYFPSISPKYFSYNLWSPVKENMLIKMLCFIYDAENNYFLPFFSLKCTWIFTMSPHSVLKDNEKNKLKDANIVVSTSFPR